MTEKVAAQAKALWQWLFQIVGMLSVVIGQGGVENLSSLTLGQWLMIIMWAGSVYGLTYMIPNGPAPIVAGKPTAPLAFSPK